MLAAKALRSVEICLAAAHEGGFAFWPSKFTKYSVAASTKWRHGKGDVLREFRDAANRWGIKICYYYCSTSKSPTTAEGCGTATPPYTADIFFHDTLSRRAEVLTSYGPIRRFYFDGDGFAPNCPAILNDTRLWTEVFETIRTVSPDTLIGPKEGDYGESNGGGYRLYTNDGPPTITTNIGCCTFPNATGTHFIPLSSHGVTIQEGPDGNTEATPTFWFWHP